MIVELGKLDGSVQTNVATFDPLRDESLLMESYFLRVDHDAVYSTVRILFDCRNVLWAPAEGNTGVLVAEGVSTFGWANAPVGLPRVQRTIARWDPVVATDSWRVRASYGFKAQFDLIALRAHFFLVDVPGHSGAPPDFTDSTDAEVRSGLADWSSAGRLIQATTAP